MNKTKIEWCDSTWNPVTGCLHGCPYCYAKGIAMRFRHRKNHHLCTGDGAISPITFGRYLANGLHEIDGFLWWQKNGEYNEKEAIAAYPFGFEPTFHRYRLDEPASKTKAQTIFVCSMADLFGKWVPTSWIVEVLDACAAAPQHRYLFLTKNPQRYIELDKLALLPRGKNFWYGSTATNSETDLMFWSKDYNTFVSIEPMLAPFGDSAPADALHDIGWFIVGAETGSRKDKVTPERIWVEQVVDYCKSNGKPAFMKDSMAPIWGEPLITEFPWEDKNE